MPREVPKRKKREEKEGEEISFPLMNNFLSFLASTGFSELKKSAGSENF